jgi:foldase protein PrsA
MKKQKLLIGLGLIILLVSGCGVAKLENGEEVVVETKNGTITADNLYQELKSKYAINVLIDLIDTSILNDLYPKADIKAVVDSQVNYYKQQLGDEFESYIQTYLGINTESELHDYLGLQYQRELAKNDYLKKIITDEEINTYYEKKAVGDYYVSHILIAPEESEYMSDEDYQIAEEKAFNSAKDIIKKLDAKEDFSTLAKEYSTDQGSAVNGGVIGWVNKNDANYSEAFRLGAYDLKKGEYSKEPVKSEFGYHIIIVTDIKEKASLEDSKESIINYIVQEKSQEEVDYITKALIDLRKEYKLNIQDSELKKAYDQYIKSLN